MAQKPSVYRDAKAGVWVVRASSLGKCPRALWAAKRGIVPDPLHPLVTKAAARGQLYEAAAKQHYQAEGAFSVVQQQRKVEYRVPGCATVVRGHTDGDVFCEGELRGLEVKSMSKSRFNQWLKKGFGAFPEYAWQLAAYACGTRYARWVYLVVERNGDEESVEQCLENLREDNVRQSLIHYEVPLLGAELSSDRKTPIGEAEIIERLEFLDTISEDMMPQCAKPMPKYCRYHKLHDNELEKQRQKDAHRAAILRDEKLRQLCVRYVALQKAARMLTPVRSQIDAELNGIDWCDETVRARYDKSGRLFIEEVQ